jgi:hypothetical protein
MARTISRLLNNIAPGPDRILNEALKTCGPLIAPWLADVARACFVIGYYLRLGRAITTFVLRKEGKADYSLLGSYRPITLDVTDLVLSVLRVLRRDLSELASSIEPVDLYNKG